MRDIFEEMRKAREEAKKEGEAARLLADDGVQPKVDGVYTVSRDFRCNDGSWTNCFWHVLAFSGPNVLVRIEGKHETLTRLFKTDERAWYDAADAYSAWRQAQ